MFCPNCGNDCGDDKFCTICGARVVQSSTQDQPNCGTVNVSAESADTASTVQTAAECAPAQKTAEKSYDIPCGFYECLSGSLTLYKKDCLLRTRILFKKYETRIPYDKITTVVYKRPLCKASSVGNLLFRWEGNRDVRIPTPSGFSSDHTALMTTTGVDTMFYHIFYMLKAIAPATASFRMIIPDANVPGVEELMQKIDAQEYFDKYAPCRDKAVEEMRQRAGATLEQATEAINRIFDARQKRIYDADPMAAIRDLNRIVEGDYGQTDNPAIAAQAPENTGGDDEKEASGAVNVSAESVDTSSSVQAAAKCVPTQKTAEKSYDIPCGFYKAITGSLSLYDKDCLLRTEGAFFKKYETRIPYDKITAVIYERPLYKATSLGHLLIRWEGNRDVPIPAPDRFSGDQTTVTTATGIDTTFYHIFYMLKAIAPATASFRMIIPDANVPGVEELMQMVDAQAYFDKYAPYRDKAVEEMRKRTGATLDQATEAVNRIFDARQKPIYDADPMAAIRDFNLIVKKKNYELEQAAKKRQEQRERDQQTAVILDELRRR